MRENMDIDTCARGENAFLAPRHQRFCEEYLLTGNATKSAIAAGYSATSAYVTGPRLLENVAVRQYLHMRQTWLSKQRHITPETLVTALLETYTRASTPIPIYTRGGRFTGRYRFDGATAVQCLETIAQILGYMRPVRRKRHSRSRHQVKSGN